MNVRIFGKRDVRCSLVRLVAGGLFVGMTFSSKSMATPVALAVNEPVVGIHSTSPASPVQEAEGLAIIAVDRQPFVAATKRLVQALDSVGRPLTDDEQRRLEELYRDSDDNRSVAEIQQLLDVHCLAGIHINPESRVKVEPGAVAPRLMENGWSTFLVKVHNEARINPALRCFSPQAQPLFQVSNGSPEPEIAISPVDTKDRWLELELPVRQPLTPTLSGLEVEYRILQLYSRESGPREATLSFDIGQGTQDLGFRNDVALLFQCQPSREVRIQVREKDSDGVGMMVALEIRDAQGRVYPNPARRLAPDFFFHNQIYRGPGESVTLPDGHYSVRISRGPEYQPKTVSLSVGQGVPAVLSAELERWIDPTQWQWYSGDHHVHAAGCAHYQNPTEGVGPEDMMRHVLGEDLKVGCVLSWGPCWYNQKQHFDGQVSNLSTGDHLMRYDVEVSGFPSSHAGHLCLLRLLEDDYPGTTRLEQWPSWTLPVLQWGQRQGGVVGYSHSGWGLMLPDYLPDGRRAPMGNNQFASASGGRAADRLPDYAMPRFDGIGANEYIVTVAHQACDFISTVDTPAIWELNIWYHTLNCGFRARISGETDFPCIYGDRVGLGRVYVQLGKKEPLEFDRWIAGLKDGRSYCGDGMSHTPKFQITGINTSGDSETVRLGWKGASQVASQLNLAKPGTVQVETTVSALLQPEPTPATEAIRNRRLDEKPYWHIERSRIGQSRRVPVELIVNGQVAQRQEIEADGSLQDLKWDIEIQQSSWVAVRILPSLHTNPIFVQVGDAPIRADRKSAEWCRQAVDVCWESKRQQIHPDERPAAEAAYQQAARIYDQIIAEHQ